MLACNVQDKLVLAFEDLGERKLKNIPRPVQVFRVVSDGAAVAHVSRARFAGAQWMWAAGAAAIMLLIVAGGAALWPRGEPGPGQAAPHMTTSGAEGDEGQAPLDKRRIAVLPFANISADREDEYFSDGMTEEMISKLSRLHDLTVIARTRDERHTRA
jgi:adenylate cyclase